MDLQRLLKLALASDNDKDNCEQLMTLYDYYNEREYGKYKNDHLNRTQIIYMKDT